MTMPTITQLNQFPFKSMGRVITQQANITPSGFEEDRRFMLVDAHHKMVTARQHRILFQVTVSQINSAEYHVTHDSQSEILVLKQDDFELTPIKTHVWDDDCHAFTTTPMANQWFSALLGESVSLVFGGDTPQRHHNGLDKDINMADDYPILLASAGSLAALNARSIQTHSMDQFRPNLVVDSLEPFIEETWQRIRIGEVIFEKGPACGRCQLTQRDPVTGESFDTQEPLSTLATFHGDDAGEVYFGQFFAPINQGVIRVNDTVEVLETCAPNTYVQKSDDTLWLRCVKKSVIADNFTAFTFVAEQHAPLPAFKAGQYVSLTVNVNGKAHQRYYTLSSSTSNHSSYEIAVKKVTDGTVSHWLNDHCEVGDILPFETPNGDFFLSDENAATDKPLLLLSAGSGITPMLSILRTWRDANLNLSSKNVSSKPIVFYHQARTEADLPCLAELSEIATQYPNITVKWAITQDSDDWQGDVGRITKAHLSFIDDLSMYACFVCGPNGFMKTAKSHLLALGVKGADYHQESFGDGDNIQEETKSINFTINQVTFLGDNQDNILKLAELNQVTIPSGCRAGLCGRCKVTLLEGEVDQKITTALTDEDKAQGKVLACCCRALSDVKIAF